MRDFILHFIRHGETLANQEGKYIGKTDLVLTSDSVEELENLREEGIYPKVSVVYSSPLSRCVQTAKTIYPDKQLIAVENLCEYDFGEYEGKTDAELSSREDYVAWRAGKLDRAAGGESMEEFKSRIYAGLVQIVKNMSEQEVYDAAIITHGGVIMTLFSLCGLPQAQAVNWACENGKGYTARVNMSIFSRSGYIEIVGTVPEC